jgi:hypothetical protein
MTETKLLPCPCYWCKGKTHLRNVGVPLGHAEYVVICEQCCASGPVDDDAARAIELWNTRPPVKPATERTEDVERLQKIRERCEKAEVKARHFDGYPHSSEHHMGCGLTNECPGEPDWTFARTDIPFLLAAIAERDKEVERARTLFEEIENYAMTANQSALDDKEPIRHQIFRDIREMAKRGIGRNFESSTYCENEKLRAQVAELAAEVKDLDAEADTYMRQVAELQGRGRE